MNSLLWSISLCTSSVVIILYWLNFNIENNPSAQEKKDMELKRQQICKLYPSNISERGIFCDAENTLPENLVAYIVAEGHCFYIVYDEDM